MFEIAINQDHLEKLAREVIEERVKEIDQKIFFMDTKQVLQYVNMSWNSFNTNIMADPNFKAAIRLGSKWLFNKKELDNYLDRFFHEVRDSGGDIQQYKRRNA
ncbi:hypothetical protein M3152_08400 [Sporosarcina luteola]|uniref:hypothetical protein n=1 Tax=Sporosarcina luteola TaxID=582850 RepID=UPI00203BB89C|nr:hypothetical protein [Sporosarcina luteola]MCM3637740.1 hypothetical protein [Sporosarcina luteola]